MNTRKLASLLSTNDMVQIEKALAMLANVEDTMDVLCVLEEGVKFIVENHVNRDTPVTGSTQFVRKIWIDQFFVTWDRETKDDVDSSHPVISAVLDVMEDFEYYDQEYEKAVEIIDLIVYRIENIGDYEESRAHDEY